MRTGPWLTASRTGLVFLVLFVAHWIVVAVRIPRNLDKKLEEISTYRELGRHAFPFRKHAPESASIVKRLVSSTPADAVLYYEGEFKGNLELAAALLYPRLLIRFNPARPERGSAFERSIARLRAPDGSHRYPVLQGRGKSLGLRWQ